MKKQITLYGREVEAEVEAIFTVTVKLDDNATVTGYGPTEAVAMADLTRKITSSEIVAIQTPKGRLIAASVTQKLE